MGKPELGNKRTCVSCAARFYDLDRELACCPKCGTSQARPARAMPASRRAPTASWPSRGGRTSYPAPVAEEVPAEAEVVEDEEEDDEDEDIVPEPVDDDSDPASEVDGLR